MNHSTASSVEDTMALETVVYLTFAVSLLTLLAVTLIYAEGAARHANDPLRRPAQFGQEKASHRQDADAFRKAA
jgi:hypothetical protein